MLSEMLSKDQIAVIKGAIKECAGSMTRVASEKDLQKEIKSNMKEEFGIEGATFNKIAKLYYEQNKNEVQMANDELIELYDDIFAIDEEKNA